MSALLPARHSTFERDQAPFPREPAILGATRGEFERESEDGDSHTQVEVWGGEEAPSAGRLWETHPPGEQGQGTPAARSFPWPPRPCPLVPLPSHLLLAPPGRTPREDKAAGRTLPAETTRLSRPGGLGPASGPASGRASLVPAECPSAWHTQPVPHRQPGPFNPRERKTHDSASCESARTNSCPPRLRGCALHPLFNFPAVCQGPASPCLPRAGGRALGWPRSLSVHGPFCGNGAQATRRPRGQVAEGIGQRSLQTFARNGRPSLPPPLA